MTRPRENCQSFVTSTTSFAKTIHADRKSTRLNSSHSQISYAVFCLKKKKKEHHHQMLRDHIRPRHLLAPARALNTHTLRPPPRQRHRSFVSASLVRNHARDNTHRT